MVEATKFLISLESRLGVLIEAKVRPTYNMADEM
jgi:hypothetical protein